MTLDWTPVQIAGLSTALSLVAGVLFASLWRGNRKASALASVPLILPPTIIAGYLLVPRFTWWMAAGAGVLYAAPFLFRSSRNAFGAVSADYTNAARALGASEWRVFWRVILPLSWKPVFAAAAIVFGRVITESALALWVKR